MGNKVILVELQINKGTSETLDPAKTSNTMHANRIGRNGYMRKAFLLMAFLVCINCTTKIVPSVANESKFMAIVENKKLNVLYRGIRNYINVYIPQADSIKVIGTGVYKINENEYYITPGQGLKTEIIIIGFIGGKKIIDRREFRLLGIQKPYASIQNYFGNVNLSKAELADSEIKIHIPQCILELPDVASFDYKINREEAIKNIGAAFSIFAKEQIDKLKKGDSVLIDNIEQITDYPEIDRPEVIGLKVYIK